jgi:hypothetical protein
MRVSISGKSYLIKNIRKFNPIEIFFSFDQKFVFQIESKTCEDQKKYYMENIQVFLNWLD